MANPKTRCAIYTRKSTDEGLEQEFNSLDAQYEACSAYIKSQKHEGWKLVKRRYDDGGISGGTMERAGLNALLDDIDAGLIDMIVVYKIDRLTRSLPDFSKIIDRLDAKGASFVSVTQSFNTATSMGRLTLNMLLSFAQFEREVTAERIRDKIAASKAKGLWMGGIVPLGYDLHPDPNTRSLVINEPEAEQVLWIFQTYLETPNLRELCELAKAQGIRSKTTKLKSGKTRGGVVMGKGAIHHILTNPIYISKIKHKDKLYDGQHEAIIEVELWERIQNKLIETAQKPRGPSVDHNYTAPLKGKLIDETGDNLTSTHTRKHGRAIRYYISNRLIKTKDPSGWRLPAQVLEESVESCVREQLAKAKANLTLFIASDIAELQRLHDTCTIAEFTSSEIFAFVMRIQLNKHAMSITLDVDMLAKITKTTRQAINPNIRKFAVNMALRKRGVETKIILGDFEPTPNTNLLDTLRKAHGWIDELKAGKSPAEIVRAQNIEMDYFRKRIGLALLSPKIQKAIVTGKHPEDWSVAKFVKTPIPDQWQAQEKLFLS